MKKIILLATIAIAFANCSKSDDNNNQSDYKLNADGRTLVQWTNSTISTIDMQADGSLQKVETIGNKAFADNKALTSITFPNNLKYIGEEDFLRANLNKEVNFNRSGEVNFGEGAFSYSNITKIYLPFTKGISAKMFANCSALTDVRFKNVGKIGHHAFFYCTELQIMDLGNAYLEEIDAAAFAQCSNLREVILPSSLKKMGESVFSNCNALQSVTINAETPPTLGINTFFQVNSIPRIYVPSNSVNAYRTAAGWKEFADKIVGK